MEILVAFVSLIALCFGYEVGVDYHAIGTNFTDSAFITQYHRPGIRSAVLSQLQGMANQGASMLCSAIWMVAEPNATSKSNWEATFPLSEQEMSNLHQYVVDLSTVQSTIDGHRLYLDISLAWLGTADYQMGDPDTGLGFANLTATEFTSRVFQTFDRLLQAIAGVKRPDGSLVVRTIYIEGEVMIGAKRNQPWFLITHYPRFLEMFSMAGFTPSMYFIADAHEEHILQDDYVDSEFPVLNGHRSMFWIYRDLYFLNMHQLPVPTRIDFSCYVNRVNATYARLVHHILEDATGTLWAVGAPDRYGIAETYYFPNATERRSLGQAFASEAMSNDRLQQLRFWTTPDAGGKGVDVAYPFAIEDYLPPLISLE